MMKLGFLRPIGQGMRPERAGHRRGQAPGRWLSILLAAALLLGGTALYAQTFTILHVNDTHSHVLKFGPKDGNLDGTIGGLAKAATVIGETRATDPNVILLHAGDLFHGTLFFNMYFGVPQLQIMRQLGFDAMAVGNHEFDYGPDILAYALSQAYGTDTLPLLSANLDMSGYPALATWVKPSIIKEIDGVKIGIFGMTVPNVPTSRPDPVVILGGDDPAVIMGIAGQTAGALRAAGAQVVIMLSHLGYAYDQAVAQNVPGIDIIVGGHDHYLFEQPHIFTNPGGTQTIVVQAGKYYEDIGKMHFTYADGQVLLDDYQIIPLDETVPDDPTVAAMLAQLQQGVEQRYGDVYYDVLATAQWDITTTYDPAGRSRDTAMGNLITDAMRDFTHTDIAVTPNGLISEGLTQGPIVGADLFRPVSYGYDPETGLGLKIATFRITPFELMKGLEVGLAYLPYDETAFLQVSGMKYKYDSTRPMGERVLKVKIHGKKLYLRDKTYTVTTNTGVLALLPLMGVNVTDVHVLPDLEYDVLKSYVEKLGTVKYKSKGRIKDMAVPQ